MQVRKCITPLIVTLGLTLQLTSCASNEPKDAVAIRGVFLEEFERTEFISCDGSTRYWVENPKAVRVLAASARAAGKAIEVYAYVSQGAPSGHNLGYDLSILIDRAKEAGDSSTCQIMDVYP